MAINRARQQRVRQNLFRREAISRSKGQKGNAATRRFIKGDKELSKLWKRLFGN